MSVSPRMSPRMRPDHPDYAKRAGFTLLEVLVALAVLAIALGALLEAAGSSAANLAYQRDRTLAAWVADNVATDIILSATAPTPGIKRGRTRMADQEWTWELTTRATDDPGLRRLDIAVSRAGSGQTISRLSAFARVP